MNVSLNNFCNSKYSNHYVSTIRCCDPHLINIAPRHSTLSLLLRNKKSDGRIGLSHIENHGTIFSTDIKYEIATIIVWQEHG